VLQIGLIPAAAARADQWRQHREAGDRLTIVMRAGVSLGLVNFALLVRLLHDTGRSAWRMLLGLIPLAGPIKVLVATLTAGIPEFNQP
jgi:uncharacterized membrane protein YhaH (DUF805 family)